MRRPMRLAHRWVVRRLTSVASLPGAFLHDHLFRQSPTGFQRNQETRTDAFVKLIGRESRRCQAGLVKLFGKSMTTIRAKADAIFEDIASSGQELTRGDVVSIEGNQITRSDRLADALPIIATTTTHHAAEVITLEHHVAKTTAYPFFLIAHLSSPFQVAG